VREFGAGARAAACQQSLPPETPIVQLVSATRTKSATASVTATSATTPASAPAPAESQAVGGIFTGADRRRHRRTPHYVPATLQPASGNADADEAVLVFNISLGGVGLICDHRYRADTVWRITLGNGPLLLNAKVKVVSCRVRGDGRFDVGCEFC
jgi:hypothetical protein